MVIKYFDPQRNRVELASFGLGDLRPEMFAQDGFRLPNLPPIKYTDVLGLAGRAGDGYGRLMETMTAARS